MTYQCNIDIFHSNIASKNLIPTYTAYYSWKMSKYYWSIKINFKQGQLKEPFICNMSLFESIVICRIVHPHIIHAHCNRHILCSPNDPVSRCIQYCLDRLKRCCQKAEENINRLINNATCEGSVSVDMAQKSVLNIAIAPVLFNFEKILLWQVLYVYSWSNPCVIHVSIQRPY